MRYDEFVRRVEGRAAGGLDQERAERAANATLATLGERIPPGEVEDLAAQLPRELQAPLRAHGARLDDFDADGFLARVADREGVSASEALHHVRAVFDVLEQAVTGPELRHVRAWLPNGFATLFAPPAAARWPDAHRHHPHA